MAVFPELLSNLVERFRRNLDQYKQSSYNETLVRVDYIDPFFELLGWDMHNRHGYAEQYREVVHEDKLKISKSTKAPDYSFRIGGVRKFFLEAKKPSVDLKSDVAPAYQVRRYAWSAGLPLSILTDFEEFAVYDCRIEPHRHDKPTTARVMYFTFDQYADAWDEISEVFAKESILRGSFDRYAESTRKKRGTAEVDDAFLAEIESWREMLAKNIALRNMEITTRELNQAVQATIDRIIFLRIAEDRGAEQYGQLQALQNGTSVYRRLVDIYRHADRRYNSGLFHFDDEKGRGGTPDEWTTELAIDDKPLKEIFRRLYYPESPYEFSVLPGSILGQVYERFLGKVIRLTKGHQAKVEEKPEVRKAGGVYYTPEYIARYIVENTVGTLLKGKGFRDRGSENGSSPKGLRDCNLYTPSITQSLKSYEHTIDSVLPGSGGLAAERRTFDPYIRGHADVPARRAVRDHESDAPRFNVDSGQHRRGACTDASEGIPSSPVDRSRVARGTGDIYDYRSEAGVHSGGSTSGSHRRSAGRGQTSQRPDPLSQPTPDPRSLTPDDVSRLRILDPACGSGSFLLTAYDYLLDWHLDWYGNNDPEKWAKEKTPPIYQVSVPPPDPGAPTPDPSWKLTTHEKKRILVNNIYGVDIDAQAVEVTKLSLLLRVLEDENEQTINVQTSFSERVLPDLEANIKCGNSLIGPDFYESDQLTAFDEETLYRVNVFDWNAEFPAIMKEGGFDAVIGNPPYIRIQHMKEWAPLEVEFYKKAYRSAGKGNYDIYVVFAEKGLELLNGNGLLGYILPHKFFNAKYGEPLREIISEGDHLRKVVHFGDAQIFADATTYTCLLFLSKKPNAEFEFEKVDDLEAWKLQAELGGEAEEREAATSGLLSLNDVTAKEWNFIVGSGQDLFRRLSEMPVKLGDVASIFQGLVTGADKAFVLDTPDDVEAELLKHFLVPDRIVPYSSPSVHYWMLFPYRIEKNKAELIGTHELATVYPLAWKYLKSQESTLRSRERGKWNKEGWHAFGRSQNLTKMEEEKLIIQVTAQKSTVIHDDRSLYMTGGGSGPFYGIRSCDERVKLLYLLGFLNSPVFDYFVKQQSTQLRGGYFKYSKQYIEGAPIRVVDFANASDVSSYDQMVQLVETMLDLHKRLAAAKTAHDKNLLQRQIEATDRQIDRLVYELYELSDEEIAVVEGIKT